MKNSYDYIDPEYVYTNPQTGVLRNLANIDERRLLVAFESIKVGLRLLTCHRKRLVAKSQSSR